MSPIVGLTDTPKSFIKLGQIRKGAPKGQNAPGKDLDYFRVTLLKGKKADELAEELLRVYGNKPAEINVRFADPDPASVWDANYECYKQGGLIAKAGSRMREDKIELFWIFFRNPKTSETIISDGRARNAEGAELLSKVIDLNQPVYQNEKGDPFYLEPVGRLKVVIPELAHIAVGYFEFRPESPKDIRNISAELSSFDGIAKQYGKTITGIPFRLERREEDVTKRINGKLVAGKSSVVHLSVSGEWGARAMDILEHLALPEIVEGEAVAAPQLPSGTEGDTEEYVNQEDVEEELAIELIDPMGDWAVKFAAKEWNVDASVAAKEIASRKLGKKFDKTEFIEIVRGERQTASS